MKQKEIERLKEFIQLEARAHKRKADQHFVHWYSGLRKETRSSPSHVTDGGDGEIDLVIEQDSSIVLAQLKMRNLHSATRGQAIREFPAA